VALSILCGFKGRDRQMVVNTILKRIKELVGDDAKSYKNFLEKTAIKMIERFNLSVDDVNHNPLIKKEELLEYMKKNQKL